MLLRLPTAAVLNHGLCVCYHSLTTLTSLRGEIDDMLQLTILYLLYVGIIEKRKRNKECNIYNVIARTVQYQLVSSLVLLVVVLS